MVEGSVSCPRRTQLQQVFRGLAPVVLSVGSICETSRVELPWTPHVQVDVSDWSRNMEVADLTLREGLGRGTTEQSLRIADTPDVQRVFKGMDGWTTADDLPVDHRKIPILAGRALEDASAQLQCGGFLNLVASWHRTLIMSFGGSIDPTWTADQPSLDKLHSVMATVREQQLVLSTLKPQIVEEYSPSIWTLLLS